VIEHLLRHSEAVEILGSVEEASRLVPLALPRAPDVILANLRLLGKEPSELIAAIKRSSPVSRLVLTSHVEVLPPAAERWGADACIAEEALVERLLPLLGKLRLTQRAASAHPSA
jgi:DNA-binding NarL/FixJ family response regulator